MAQIKRYLDKTGLEHLVEILKQYPTNAVLKDLVDDLQSQIDSKVSSEGINDTITSLVANAGDNIFWVEYGITTKQQINTALGNDRFPVIIDENDESGFTIFAPLAETNWTYYTFTTYLGGSYYKYRLELDNNEWTKVVSDLKTVSYETTQNLTTTQKRKARTNIGAISADDVPDIIATYLDGLDGDGLEY